jgi:hypothetical protein
MNKQPVNNARFAKRIGMVACVAALLLIPGAANAQPINVITVDCTPFVSPSGSSFGPTNTMGMALQAVDLGGDFNVTEVTPAAFRILTAVQLSAYDLIAVNNHPFRLGDNCVPGAGNGLGTNWHSAVGVNGGGRVVLNSHDAPRFKMQAPTPAGPLFTGFEPFGTKDLVRQAALWAGGIPGLTGLLIFNDAARFTSGPGIPIGGVGWDNAELNLPAAWGIIDADQSGGTFMNGGYTDILPAFALHPLYVGISDQRFAPNTISSFAANISDTSFHSVFAAFNPAIFTPTEVVINSGIPDVGGMCFCSGNDAAGPDGLAITLIREEEICEPDPSTQGYWHRQCLGAGLITPGRNGNGRGPTTVLEPDFVKTLVPAVDLRLQASIFIPPTFRTCEDGIDAEPPSDKCEKALKQYTAMLLNIDSGRLQESCRIDLSAEGCNSATIGDLVIELAGLINNADQDSCKQAAACAGAINENGGVGVCNPGRDDCDGDPSNGCEIDLNSDPDNCGFCGNVCSFPGAVGICEAGVCVLGPCASGFADCDGDPANACETNIAGDPDNCSACGVACSFTNADPLCVGGVCQMGACWPGWGDCDADPANGCEVDLTTDPNHCGACGNLCILPNASGVCAGATCQVGQCNPLFDDCDLISSSLRATPPTGTVTAPTPTVARPICARSPTAAHAGLPAACPTPPNRARREPARSLRATPRTGTVTAPTSTVARPICARSPTAADAGFPAACPTPPNRARREPARSLRATPITVTVMASPPMAARGGSEPRRPAARRPSWGSSAPTDAAASSVPARTGVRSRAGQGGARDGTWPTPSSARPVRRPSSTASGSPFRRGSTTICTSTAPAEP